MNTGDPELDAFLPRVPTLRTSDLIGFVADPRALAARLGLSSLYPSDARSVCDAALDAIKDEIDRRLPIPEGGS